MKRADIQKIMLKLHDGKISVTEATDEVMKLNKEKEIIKKIPQADIDEVYKSYPTRCVVRGAHLGKSWSNKKQIERVLQKREKEDILYTINRYVNECREKKVYMKNFSTFLNNIPEFEKIEPIVVQKKPYDGMRNVREIIGLQ